MPTARQKPQITHYSILDSYKKCLWCQTCCQSLDSVSHWTHWTQWTQWTYKRLGKSITRALKIMRYNQESLGLGLGGRECRDICGFPFFPGKSRLSFCGKVSSQEFSLLFGVPILKIYQFYLLSQLYETRPVFPHQTKVLSTS